MDLESLTLERKCASLTESRTPSPKRATSPRPAERLPSPLASGFMALLQTIQDNAEAQQRRADERADRQEARHEAQMAALTATRPSPAPMGPTTSAASTGFKSNHCFHGMTSFSGEDRQPLRPWFCEFQNKVDIARLSEDDAMCELRLKLVGIPSALTAAYVQAFDGDDAKPSVLGVLAYLAKDYGIPYEEASLYAAYVQGRRTAHTSGREYLRTLSTARRNLQAAGIPLTLSPAEQSYYMCELGLSALQRPTFLAQLSAKDDVSDDYLQSLSLATSRRRESLLNPQDSNERQACFARRLNMIEAFLNHDQGEGKAARAAATTGTTEDAHDPGLEPQTLATPSQPDRAARVLALKAGWAVRRDRPGPPPQYHGPNARHLAENQATYDRRIATNSCFGCTVDQMKATPDGQMHWKCKHHGEDATPEERLVRVLGSGSGTSSRSRPRHA